MGLNNLVTKYNIFPQIFSLCAKCVNTFVEYLHNCVNKNFNND